MSGICTGICVIGKCPNPVCVKYQQKEREAKAFKIGSQILESSLKESICCDKEGYGFAVDIGTTTVVVYLYSLADAKVLCVKSSLNSQITLGVDVISRIQYCDTVADGLDAMQTGIVRLLNELFEKCCIEAEVSLSDVSHAVITGNTTMEHLLCGVSPVSMGKIPFKAETLFGNVIKGKDIGLVIPDLTVFVTRCISAFVGGDITSAMLACNMHEGDEINLLMDLGTNGELAIGNKHKMFTTSTAAGPAFEGAEIECGMAGVEGAVCSVYPYQGEIRFDVLGNGKPVGICGSGILDMTALFVKLGVIDASGYILDADEVPETVRKYVVEIEGQNRIVLSDRVYLTQKDIRKLQMAKAAVAAGVNTLMIESGFPEDQIRHVYIAGGFGNYMRTESAIAIGLLDSRFENRFYSIGNGAGVGAVKLLLNDEYRNSAEKLADVSVHVELGGSPVFMEEYVSCMSFPSED